VDSPNTAPIRAFLRSIPAIITAAVTNAAKEYAGVPIESGGVSAASREAGVGRHFTRTNVARYGWQPLAPDYAVWKAKRFGAKPVLVASGTLKASILGRATVTVAGPGRLVVRFGQAVDYAQYHQDGDGVPKRSPIDPNPDDIAAIKAAARKHFQALVQRAAAKTGVVVRVTA
jgi:phage gpG-like protein